MSRLHVPFQTKRLWATGETLLRAELDLAVKTRDGNWLTQVFRADPGSEVSTMPACLAKQLNLPMPAASTPGISGHSVRTGVICAKIVGMESIEYVFPCFFLGDPEVPVNPMTSPLVLSRCLLGLTGVVDKLRLTFDGTPVPGANFGQLIVEKI